MTVLINLTTESRGSLSYNYPLGQAVDGVEELGLVLSVLGQVEDHLGPQPDLGVTQVEDVAHLHHSHGVFEAALALSTLAHTHGSFYERIKNTSANSANKCALHKFY